MFMRCFHNQNPVIKILEAICQTLHIPQAPVTVLQLVSRAQVEKGQSHNE